MKTNANFPENAADGEPCQVALVVLDSETSEIRAVMGGRQYETRRGLNRVVDMKRQPGSTIKPVLVYAPAMEKLGYTPATLVLDEKGDFDGYVPKNFSDNYAGWVTLRRALASSLNLPAVRTLDAVGVEAAKLYASRVGIPFDKEDTGLPLALGGFTMGVTPLSLGNAFTPFANGGYYSLSELHHAYHGHARRYGIRAAADQNGRAVRGYGVSDDFNAAKRGGNRHGATAPASTA